MNSTRKRAMAEGRKRWERQQRRDALDRVAAFERWLKAGSPSGGCPVIPSDADYAAARRAGKVNR